MNFRHLIFVFAFLLFNNVQAAQTCISTPIPVNGQDVNAFSGSSDTNIIAVADNANGSGQISIFNGTSWVLQTDPDIPNEDFLDVFVFDDTNAVAVGDNGSVVIQVNGDWVDISVSNQDYTTIWAYSNSDIFIAGDNGRIYHYDGSSWSANLGSGSNNDDFVDSWGDGNYVYFLDDDGEVFRYDKIAPFALNPAGSNPISPNCSGRIDFNGFTRDGAGNFYLLGENRSPSPNEGVIFKWDGINSWNADTCNNIYQTSLTDDINALNINPDGSFTAVGNDGLVVTSADGTTWTEISSGGQNINDIYTLSNGSSILGANNGSNQICTEDTPHFSIIHDGLATTCTAEAIKIQFHDASHVVDTTYTGTINISTSSGNGTWALLTGTNSGSFSDNGNGNASYTFVAGDSGEILLSLANTTAETLNLNLSDGTYTEYFTEDTNLTFSASGASSFSYIDNFSSQAFNNSDGSADWTLTPWTEINDNNIADSGRVRITGSGRLRVGGNNDNRGISRQLELSAAASATLSFSYRRRSLDNGGEYVALQISSDGTTWNTLDTFKGPQNDASFVTTSYPIDTQYFTANTQIRFLGNNLDAGAGADRVLFDNVNITAITASLPCGGLHHIEFIHDTSALTCNPESITLKACANTDCSTLVTSAITVDLLPTGWIGGDLKTFSTGTATYNLSHTTAEVITLATNSTTPAATNTVICKNASDAVISCNMTFNDSGFIYTVPTQTSCTTSAAITIQAVRLDDTTQTCIPAFQNIDRNLKIWASYSNPAAADISGTPAVTLVNGNGSYTLPSTEPGATNVNMSFAGSADETITVLYPDAGQLVLNTKYEGSAANSDIGLTMLGNSTFVVKPHSYYLQGYYDNAGTDVNLNNATASGNPTWIASDNFRFRLRGQCQDGTVTANYEPTNAELLVELNLPVGGANANLTLQGTDYISSAAASPTWHNISTKFNNGAITDGVNNYANAAFHEVGVLNLHVRDLNYFGTSIAEQTQIVGRFTPHHFDTTVVQGCNTFTYSGQPFSVTATAKNNAATPATTQNYESNFAYDTTLSNAGDVNNFTNNTISANRFSGGTGFQSPATLAYTFPAKDTIPATITLRANDADTGTTAGVIEGTTMIRSGRARLENVFGPELTPLIMPLNIEYYSDNTLIYDPLDPITTQADDGFILNTDDSCTTYDATLGALTNYTGNLSTGETTLTGAGAIAAGVANISFSAPGTGNDGSVNLLANNIDSWLTYNWNVDCDNADADDDITTGIDAGLCGPYGTASFGLYRGDDRVIYWREVF